MTRLGHLHNRPKACNIIPPTDSAGRMIVIRSLFIATTALAMVATPALAKPCRDGKGKFVKCSEKPAKIVKCKNTKTGKFAKCGTPDAKPI